MKRLITLILFFFCLNTLSRGQDADPTISEIWHTLNTTNLNAGKWTKIAECNITSAYQDFCTTFYFLGNGSGNKTMYFGQLIARFKNQSSSPNPVNFWKLVLFDSNLGAENIKAVRNGTKVEIYIRIPNSYTRVFLRRILNGSTPIQPISDQLFLNELPSGDLTIECENGSVFSNSIEAKKIVVDGLIEAKEIKVSTSPGADYVFEKQYNLVSLKELESFIKINKHLPDIPSATDMEKNGLDLAEMNRLLLQKIEELTLYQIQLLSRIKKLENQSSKKSVDGVLP